MCRNFYGENLFENNFTQFEVLIVMTYTPTIFN